MTLKTIYTMKTLTPGTDYALKDLTEMFGLRRLHRFFADMEIFSKKEQAYLFKAIERDRFVLFSELSNPHKERERPR